MKGLLRPWPRAAGHGAASRRGLLMIAGGALAWLAAVAVWTAWLPAERSRLDALRGLAKAAAQRAARQGDGASRLAADPPPGQRFLAAFPGAQTRPQRVEALLDAATANKLAWQRSEFRTLREAMPGLARYQMTLPFSGDYAAIRGFVAEALGADPALVLERLQMRRKTAAATQIDVETVWSLYTRDAPIASPSASLRAGASR